MDFLKKKYPDARINEIEKGLAVRGIPEILPKKGTEMVHPNKLVPPEPVAPAPAPTDSIGSFFENWIAGQMQGHTAQMNAKAKEFDEFKLRTEKEIEQAKIEMLANMKESIQDSQKIAKSCIDAVGTLEKDFGNKLQILATSCKASDVEAKKFRDQLEQLLAKVAGALRIGG